jgi:hypothetical protein
MDPATRAAHDAYHRLVRAGAWSLEALWAAMVTMVIEHLGPEGRLVCYLGDTLFHRPGRKVDGAGSFRDAVRSTANRVVFARGLSGSNPGPRAVGATSGADFAMGLRSSCASSLVHGFDGWSS